MKKLFTILAVAATLVSCAKEDVVREAAREAIGFDNAFVENSTRSVFDPSFSNTNLFGNFGVFGTVEGAELFDNTTVSGNALNGTWSYEGTQYWITGAKYNFAAVAPQTVKVNDVDTPVYTNASFATTSTGENAEKVYTGTTTLSFENNGTTDLLYAEAKATGLVSSNPKVAFTFRHVLSKVKFSFLNNYNANNTTIQVRGIKINNAFTTGNVALTATTTTWSDWATNLVLEFGNAAEAAVNALEPFVVGSEKESYNELLLIPYNYNGTTNAKLAVEFYYDIVVSEEVVATFKVEPNVAVNLEPGHAYDFKATITPGEPIEFTVLDITDWDNDHDRKENTEAGDTDGDNQVETPLQ